MAGKHGIEPRFGRLECPVIAVTLLTYVIKKNGATDRIRTYKNKELLTYEVSAPTSEQRWHKMVQQEGFEPTKVFQPLV